MRGPEARQSNRRARRSRRYGACPQRCRYCSRIYTGPHEARQRHRPGIRAKQTSNRVRCCG